MSLNPVLAGARSLATNQVSVGSSATMLVSPRSTRRSILIVNVGGSSKVYIGTAAVTTALGSYLPAVDGASVSIPTTADVWAIVSSGSQTVSVMEVFD